MSYYLAIDQGSHASRAFLFDETGNIAASCSNDVVANRPAYGRVEHDAGQLLFSVRDVLAELITGLDRREQEKIIVCGIATQRSTVLAWQSNGEPIGPVLSWQDVRAADFVETLRSHERRIQQLTGLPLSAHYGASKLGWLLGEISPASVVKQEEIRLSPLVSFLLYHLIENKPYVVDHSNAQRTQLMDLVKLDWSKQLTQWFGVPVNYLPECKPMLANYGILSGTQVSVTAVCGDQNAALFGTGEISNDTALINLGSGAFILRPLPEHTASQKQLTGIASSGNKTVSYLREATINGAGSALSWVAEKYGIDDIRQRLPAWLQTIEAPPLFINTVGGLGSPWWRQDIEAEFIGHNDFNNKGALVVAVIESIAFMLFANIVLMMEESPLKILRVSGGLSNVDGLCQKLASLSRLTVERTDNPEATARGVAWLAAGSPADWGSPGTTDIFRPIPDKALNQRYSQYIKILEIKLGE